MATRHIITMTAANRMGILSAVTKGLSDLGADLLEASQTVVHGYFTMIFCAEFSSDLQEEVILAHLMDVGRPFDIDVTIKNVTDRKVESGGPGDKIYSVRLGGTSQPGLLKKLSGVIARHEVDIFGMRAVQTNQEDTQGFEMHMKLAVPDKEALDRLLLALNELGQEEDFTANRCT